MATAYGPIWVGTDSGLTIDPALAPTTLDRKNGYFTAMVHIDGEDGLVIFTSEFFEEFNELPTPQTDISSLMTTFDAAVSHLPEGNYAEVPAGAVSPLFLCKGKYYIPVINYEEVESYIEISVPEEVINPSRKTKFYQDADMKNVGSVILYPKSTNANNPLFYDKDFTMPVMEDDILRIAGKALIEEYDSDQEAYEYEHFMVTYKYPNIYDGFKEKIESMLQQEISDTVYEKTCQYVLENLGEYSYWPESPKFRYITGQNYELFYETLPDYVRELIEEEGEEDSTIPPLAPVINQ